MNFKTLFKGMLTIFSFLLIQNNLIAQDFYLALGTNISRIDYSPENNGVTSTENKYQLGLQTGVAVEIKINEYISFFPQAYVSLKRKKTKTTVNIENLISSDIEGRERNLSLDIPLDMKINVMS
ncbi:outer membrane beta-barrel protein [Flammeovirga aprica]|uniref:Outer membrane beta-barrel protein n=1 Tax=Flammeovirga aprica JL-4 TaxID=694437 RepID=A0A7X9RZF2_9BACT|nr:outer membrane beta-barrel protein [Flammeovirga aprica]NME71536.1 outer membrane beta-barrel protein [Flammeovirga aprica JL-4]